MTGGHIEMVDVMTDEDSIGLSLVGTGGGLTRGREPDPQRERRLDGALGMFF